MSHEVHQINKFDAVYGLQNMIYGIPFVKNNLVKILSMHTSGNRLQQTTAGVCKTLLMLPSKDELDTPYARENLKDLYDIMSIYAGECVLLPQHISQNIQTDTAEIDQSINQQEGVLSKVYVE